MVWWYRNIGGGGIAILVGVVWNGIAISVGVVWGGIAISRYRWGWYRDISVLRCRWGLISVGVVSRYPIEIPRGYISSVAHEL